MAVAAAQMFGWSEKEYSLKTLVAEFQHLLPFAIMITQGYNGGDEQQSSWSTSEVFWLHNVIKRSWIVVQNKNGQTFSIPGYYDAEVKPIKADGKEGKPIEVHQVFLRDDIKYIVLNDGHDGVGEVGSRTSRQPPNKVRIIKKVQEDVLVMHSIYTNELFEVGQYLPAIKHLPKGVVDPTFVLLPTDLPIQVAIALSVNTGEDHRYFYIMTDIKQIVDNYDHDYIQHMKENTGILPGDLQHSSNELTETKKSMLPVNTRWAPVIPHRKLDPINRLLELRRFYDRRLSDLILKLRRQKSTPAERKPKRYTTIGQPLADKASPDLIAGSRITQHRDESHRKLLRQRSNDVQIAANFPDVHTYRASTALDDFQSIVTDKAFDDLNVDGVITCLDALHLSRYKSAIRDGGVDGKRLAKLQERGLQREFGFSQIDASVLMDFARKKTQYDPEYRIPDTVRRKLPESSYVVLNESITPSS